MCRQLLYDVMSYSLLDRNHSFELQDGKQRWDVLTVPMHQITWHHIP
jgi:hypothetical protein